MQLLYIKELLRTAGYMTMKKKIYVQGGPGLVIFKCLTADKLSFIVKHSTLYKYHFDFRNMKL